MLVKLEKRLRISIEFGDEEYEPVVKIILDQDKNEVIISDNGSGMNIEILKNIS